MLTAPGADLRSFVDRRRRWPVNVFIAFHIVAIAAWGFPFEFALKSAVNGWTAPYMNGIGPAQNWQMFAPNPRVNNFYMEAEVVLRDGTCRVWPFPRMDKMGLLERYRRERYRKWGNDSVWFNNQLWPDTARYIARLHRNPGNPPRSVTLVRHWSEIPAPSDDELPDPTDKPLWREHKLFTYRVRPGDLS